MVTSPYLKLLFLASLFAGMLCSCNDEIIISGNPTNPTQLTINVNLPAATCPKPTKSATQTLAESQLNEVQVLVFENGSYSYRAQGFGIVNNDNSTASFTARLSSSSAPVTLYFIANSVDVIQANEPQAGASIAQVTQQLTRAYTTSGVSGNVAFWGSYSLPSGISGTSPGTISGANLLRAVARVDVVVASSTTVFQLASVQAFRAASSIQLIPNNPSALPDVSEPSVPVGSTYSINTDPIAAASNTFRAQLYLPESVAPDAANQVSEATCIVLGGYLNGSATLSYYRLDFNPTTGNHPLGQILRNYCYEFLVSEISAPGAATAEEAANNPSFGMIAEVVQWQDFDITFMYFNNTTYVGLSDTEATLPGEPSATNIFVQTNFSGYTIAFSDANGVPIGAPSTTVIASDNFTVLIAGVGGDAIIVNSLNANPVGSEPVVEYVIIQAGTLSALLTLVQEAVGDLTWAVGNVDLPGTFAPLGEVGMFYQWNNPTPWPSTGTVTGWDVVGSTEPTWQDINNPCPAGWRLPTEEEVRMLMTSPGKAWRTAGANYPVSGTWFASTQDEALNATLAEPGNAIFLPGGGGRDDDGILFNVNSNGYYWTSETDVINNQFTLTIASGTTLVYAANYRTRGFCIRCIQ